METDEKFEQIYSKIVEENGQKLEELRKAAKKEIIRNLIVVATCLIICFIGYKIFLLNEKIVNFIVFFYGIMFMIILIFGKKLKRASKISEYKKMFKNKVIKTLIDSFGEKIEYDYASGIDSEIYKQAEFEKFDIYNSDDYMYGTLKNKCDFKMAEVITEDEFEDEEGKKTYYTLFKGIFASVTTPKKFDASLYLRSDRRDKNMVSKNLTWRYPFEKLKVNLDSQEFEKYFDVYSSDKIIAMQLLTADIMQLLINFKDEMKMKYELTIKNNYIYLRFMSGRMFESNSIFKSSLDKKVLYKYYKILDFVFSLTDKLINLIKETEY